MTGFQAFELTAADYCFPMFYAGCTISFRLKSPNLGVSILAEAVKRVTDRLPFLTGVVGPSKERPEIMEVRSETTNGLEKLYPPLCDVQRFPHLRLPRSDLSSKEENGGYDRDTSHIMVPLQIAALSADHPVIRFQINVLADGIILSLFANHMVIDGTGIGTLIELLAANSGSCQEHSQLQSLSMNSDSGAREVLSTISQKKANPQVLNPLPTYTIVSNDIHDSSLVDYNFHISIDKIKLLHQQALQTSMGVSQDDVVTAALWVCLSEIRSRPGENGMHMCSLQRLINARHRLRPSLPAHFVGNCFVLLNESAGTKELQTKNIGEPRKIIAAACRLREGLNQVDDRYVRKYLAQFSKPNDWASTTIHQSDVTVSSLRRLRVYQNFGPVLGDVIYWELLPYACPEGVCTIRPARGPNDAWEVNVSLNRTEMDMLRKNSVFSWLVEYESPFKIFESNV
ncbi:hypothetical protein LOZ66_001058 [Ophidiomyces ophidiicola]|nr:hypothetical protein LOZ66_001058 [Ophidiomyces ophidiicola]